MAARCAHNVTNSMSRLPKIKKPSIHIRKPKLTKRQWLLCAGAVVLIAASIGYWAYAAKHKKSGNTWQTRTDPAGANTQRSLPGGSSGNLTLVGRITKCSDKECAIRLKNNQELRFAVTSTTQIRSLSNQQLQPKDARNKQASVQIAVKENGDFSARRLTIE